MFRSLTIAALAATVMNAGTAHAENVEIYLTDMLDNIQVGHGLDIARAQGSRANADEGLQGHTYYSPGGKICRRHPLYA